MEGAGEEEKEDFCCARKSVGGVTYLLTGRDNISTSQFGCLTECVYRREDTPGSRICFSSGTLAPECLVLHESLTNVSSALPALDNSNYQEKGQVVDLGGIEVYRVGSGSRCIIWNYDIMGFQGGRSRQMCDQLASQGFTLIMPDYFRGGKADFSLGWQVAAEFVNNETQWSQLKVDWEEKVKPYAEEQGCTAFSAIGTCWGSYMTVRLSSLPDFKAGVSMHPSHSGAIPGLLENETQILEQVVAPQLMMPSKTDSVNVKTGGLTEQVLGRTGVEVSIVEFPTMDHGWTTRGDLEVAEIFHEVVRAMETALAFFQKHMPE